MNAHQSRRRCCLVVYSLCVLMGLPPGMLCRVAAAERRTGTFTHDGVMETLRNPQFSSGTANRFLFTQGPTTLVGRGGSSFASPAMAGYRSFAEPESLYLPYRGKVEWSARDLFMRGVGLDLSFERIWRGSVSTFDGPLGLQWEFNWNKRLFEANATSNVSFYENGRKETYTYSAGNFSSPAGRYDSLVRQTTPNPDEYTRTDRDGIKETYEFDTNSGSTVTWYRLKEIRDLNDNTLVFAYDGDRNLTKMTDTLSRDTTLAYDGNARMTKITDSASREWIYGYDGSGLLTTVRTPTVDETGSEDDYTSGKTTTYKYDGSNNLTEVARPGDGATGKWKWAYNSVLVTKETRNGNDTTLTFDGTSKNVTVSDPEGINTRYTYNDDTNRLITKREVFYGALNTVSHWDTTWAYDANNEVTSVIFPEGNRILYSYDGSGNIVTVDFKQDADDASPVRWIYTYASNARLSTLKDPNGNLWDYDWDAKGNLTRKAAPAVTVPGDIETTDNNGNSIYDGTIVETWAYNSSGQVTRYTDAAGTDWDMAYTTVNAKLAYPQYQIADAGGLDLTTTYAYDSKGNVTSVTDPESHVTTYTVNALNQTIRAVEPGSVTKEWHYDANDRVTSTAASNDSTVGNSWYVVDHQYDVLDNLTKTIADVDGTSTRLTTAYVYDKNDRLTKVTSPVGNDTEYRYDQRDLRTSTIRKAASSPDDAITILAYDANGNVTSSTDPRANVTTYTLDGYDRVITTSNPLGHYVLYAYDKNGNVTQQTWKNAGNTTLAQTTNSFDEANRLYIVSGLAKKADLSTNIGDGAQDSTIWHDERGAVLEHSGDVCGCAAIVHTYDAVGRQVTTADPMPNSNLVITAYDKDGNVTKRTLHDETQDAGIEADKDIVTELVLDARHNVVSKKEKLTTSPTYAITVYSYGLRDQVTKVVDPEADEVRFEHNEQLWKTKDTAENGSADVITAYTYDADGRMVTYAATNSTTGNQSTIYAFDKLDRVVTTTWPDSDTHIYAYDKASNRISTTDPNTSLTVSVYDAANQLTSQAITLNGGAIGITSLTFAYDGLGRRTQADMAEASYSSGITWSFNTLSKPQTEKQVINGYNSGNGRTITWDWDVNGQKTGVTYPVSGSIVTYDRDELDRVDKITRDGTQVADYAFNGRRIIRKGMPGSEALYTYDLYGRLTQVHHKDTGSGNTLAKFAYAYDKSHHVTSQDKYFYDDVQNTRITTDTVDKGDQYEYDGAGRLVTVLRGVQTAYIGDSVSSNISNNRYDDKVEYILDQTGNRLTRKIDGSDDAIYAHNTVNEMTTEGAQSGVVYTDNGNFERMTSVVAEHRKYDFRDQHAFWDNGNLLNRVSYTWHYDALGRQIARVKSGSGTGSTDVRMYYDGQDDVEVVTWASSTETQSRRSVYGETIDELLELTDYEPTPDELHYAHADKLGSIMLMVTNGGEIEESYRYKDYGETTVVDNTFTKLGNLSSNINNWKRYTGRERMIGGSVSDPWYHYRARAYRADAGRFLQRDLLTYSDGASMYIYAAGNPVNMRDPLGLTAFPPGNIGFPAPAGGAHAKQKWCNANIIMKKHSAGGAAAGCEATLVVAPGQQQVPNMHSTTPLPEGQYIDDGDCKWVWEDHSGHWESEPCKFNVDVSAHIDIASCPRGLNSWQDQQSSQPRLSGNVTSTQPLIGGGLLPTTASQGPPVSWGHQHAPTGSLTYALQGDIECGGAPSVQMFIWLGSGGSFFIGTVESSCEPECPTH